MKTAYLFAIAYFALMAMLLLASGIWIFVEKIGVTPDAVLSYYGGDAALGLPPKSVYGQLEVMVPHLGAIGLFIMVATHFLIFAPKRRSAPFVRIAAISFAAALLNIFSGLFVSFGLPFFAYVKLAAFVLFSLAATLTLGLLLYESARTLHHQRSI